ncbi:unnamed protein product, partial [marine sediment metagenome]
MRGHEYTLYWEALSGAIAPQAMLEEMGIAYNKIAVDMEKGEQRSLDYLAINPTGQVPALKLPDGTVIGESAAMVLVLGELHPKSGLVPEIGDPERPHFIRWLVFMAASVYMTFVRVNHPERFIIDVTAIESVRAAAIAEVNRHFAVLNSAIEGAPFFLRQGFTALDIYICMLTVWHPDLSD